MSGGSIADRIERVHADEWARIVAALTRLSRDFDVAEDCAQEAFVRAVSVWNRDGIPANPGGWLMTTARNALVDRARRDHLAGRALPKLIVERDRDPELPAVDLALGDDRLRLIFTCCHPAIPVEARLALTLRLVCGLGTSEIASLFLVQDATMAARITRAKKKIATAGVPYRIPDADVIAARIDDVLTVISLVYAGGHTSIGETLRNPQHVALADRLSRLMVELVPSNPEVLGLRAMILLSEARQSTRVDVDGNPILLEDMDRSVWNRSQIAEGITLTEVALRGTDSRAPGRFALQAGIAACHAEAASAAATDWPQILALYSVLAVAHPSSVVELGRAVATGMVHGPDAGLREIERVATDGNLARYAMVPAARADMYRRMACWSEAATAFREAGDLAQNEPMARWFMQRATECEAEAAIE